MNTNSPRRTLDRPRPETTAIVDQPNRLPRSSLLTVLRDPLEPKPTYSVPLGMITASDSLRMFSNILPEPLTTAPSGSGVTMMGIPVSLASR